MRSVLLVLALAARAAAQPPNGPPPAGGGGGGGGGDGATAYTQGVVPQAAGLRGTIGTVDKPVSSDKTLIYGPFEVRHPPHAAFTGCGMRFRICALFQGNHGRVLGSDL